MKIKEKEIEYYARVYDGLVTKGVLRSIEKDLTESLDNLVLALQTLAYDAEKEKERHQDIPNVTRLGYYHGAKAYLDAVREINKVFGTNYSQNIDNIKKHFETKKPAKEKDD